MTAWILTIVIATSGGFNGSPAITSQAMIYPDRELCDKALAAHVKMIGDAARVFGTCTESWRRLP